jgi:exosortase
MVGLDQTAAVRSRSAGLSWPLAVGLVALAIPAAFSLGAETWSNDAGAHGPLVIATAVWLLWRELSELQARGNPGSFWIVCCALVPALAMYIAGEAFDSITLEAFGLYVVVGMVFYALFGAREIARNWFIFVYLLFAVPPPRSWLDMATFPLKQFVSSLAVTLLQLCGMPVSHQGVVIYAAQYQFLVEDACSGLNSIIGLVAISLLYIYLARRSSWRYAVLLAALTIPIAIIANMIRIVVLILLTLWAGDDVAQGFMHFAAGIVLFAIALGMIFLIDFGLTSFSSSKRRCA